ncbi:3-isopropylmalate dehydratase small subunit [Phreatobacter oligotrophus]|uniref:3-isopropylmalate dehydratase n=1 Tax=Phreatobacter oligotrophus TaxID=1122261 RepID=A0A2T4ZI61_9HYPH|nr:3-isopropylmalate dehydratase small subunit [Phreatobacter oligotrophus]PTM61656.1 3-isopropylmalate/(R)-2-methylmalate dehydratase small subunit [Phreatobacter oligotrophus]
MTPFTRESAALMRLPVANVDTDQLIPARFMKEPRKPDGYGRFLLRDLVAEGTAPAPAPGQTILVARRNFGCGSSREAAVYALADFGFRAVIAPSFGDIFASNCVKNGVVPATVSEEDAERLLATEALPATVDLEAQTIACGNVVVPFRIDPVWRTQLLNGWDDIDLTLAEADSIAAYTARDAAERPWAAPRRG